MAAPACSLLVSTSDLSGGGGAPPANDAASNDGPTTTNDATGGTDAGPVADGGTGAVDARACDATFCDDFDTPPLGAKWDLLRQVAGGSLSLGGGGLSPPNVLVLSATGTAMRVAYLEKRFPVVSKRITCGFALRPVAIPSSGGGGGGVSDIEVFSLSSQAPGNPAVFLKLEPSQDPQKAWVFYYASASGDAGQIAETLGEIPMGAFSPVLISSDGSEVRVTLGSLTSTRRIVGTPGTDVTMRLGETGDNDDLRTVVEMDDLHCTVE